MAFETVPRGTSRLDLKVPEGGILLGRKDNGLGEEMGIGFGTGILLELLFECWTGFWLRDRVVCESIF